MNRPFKTLSTTALAAVLAASALVPAASAAPTTQAVSSLDSVIVSLNGENVKISLEDYANLLELGKIQAASVKYVQTANGNNYTLADYSDYLDLTKNVNEAAGELEDKGNKQTVSNLKEGTIVNGEIVVTPVTEDFEVTDIAAINKTSVTVTLKDTPSESPVNGDFNVTVGGEKVSVTAVTKDATDLTGKTFKLSANLDKQEGKVVVNGKEAATAVDFKAPEVASAKSLAKNIVEVTFTEDVNAGLANVTANYGVVETGTANVLAVSAVEIIDAKTVRLTTAAQSADKNYTVTVNNMQDVSANKNNQTVSSSKAFVGVEDTVKPTLSSAVSKDANLIELTMSEELKTAPTVVVKAYDAQGEIVNTPLANTTEVKGNKVLVTVTNSADFLKNGSKYNVALTAGTGSDLSNNAVAEGQATDVIGVADVTAPTVVGSTFKDGKLTINFSEEMTKAGLETIGNYNVFETNTGIAATATNPTASKDNKSVTLDLSGAGGVTGGKDYSVRLTGNTTATGLKDAATVPNALANNTIVKFSTPETIVPVTVSSANTTAPANDGKTVNVKFNTTLTKAEAENINNYKIAQTADDKKVLAVTKAVYDEDSKTVTLTTDAQEQVNYTVTVSNLANLDTTVVGNYTAPFQGLDKIAPSLTSIKPLTKKSVDLMFDQDLNGTQDTLDIKVVEKGTANVVALSTSTTPAVNGKNLRVTFENDLVAGKEYTMTVKGVKDAVSNQSTSITKEFTAIADTTAAAITDVKVVNSGKIAIQFNEELQQNVGTIADYELKQGSTVIPLTGVTPARGTDKTTVELSAGSGVEFLEDGKDYTITVKGGVTDLSGNITTNTSYAFTGVQDIVKPEVVGAKAVKDNEVLVTFSEDVANINTATDYLVTNAATGVKLDVDTAVYAKDTAGDDIKTQVLLKLKPTFKTELNKEYKVYVQGNNIEDTAVKPNKLNDDKRIATFTGVDTTSPAVVGDVELTNAKTIKLTFDEKINATTATKEAFDVKLNSTSKAVNEVKVDSTGKVVTLTLADALTTTDAATLTVKVLKDKISDVAGNKATSDTTAIAVADKANPLLTKSEITGDQTVTLTFSEDVKAITLDATEREAFASINGSTIASVVADGSNEVVITTSATISGTPTITLKAGQESIEDAFGNVYAGGDIKVLNRNAGALALEAATDAVEAAELSEAQADVDTAQDLVTALPAGDAKNALQLRVTAVQDVIDAATALEAATDAVEATELSEAQADVDTAQGLVTALPAGDAKNALQLRVTAIVVAPSESNLEKATFKPYIWSGQELGASIVLQFAGTDLEILPTGTKVSVLDTNGTVLATNTAKTGISINRSLPAVKYGATTTFIYNNPSYDGASWNTTTGSLTNLDQIKQVKIEYTIDDIKYEKIVNAEVYVGE